MDSDDYKSRLLDGFDIEQRKTEIQEFPSFIAKQRKCDPCLGTFCFQKLPKIKEIDSYYQLKGIALQLYDPSNETHENSLKHLYIQIIGNDVSPDLTSEEWHKIGFQVHK
jgi:hypothetical protein